MNSCITFTKLRVILFLIAFSSMWISTQAQVKIGDLTKAEVYSVLEISTKTTSGGLRLPHLTSAQRNDIKTYIDNISDATEKESTLSELKGLTIYNITTNCVEYWNGSNWIGLCTGQTNLTIEGVNPFEQNFPCLGEDRGPFKIIDSTPCSSQSPFSVVVVIGQEFINISAVKESEGLFKVSVFSNPTARARYGVVRVINNCSKESTEYIVIQEGCTDKCQPAVDRPILDQNISGDICKGGSIYLTISNVDPTAHYVWTLNDKILPLYEGKTYCNASESGNYKVYVGVYGCENSSEIKNVKIGSSTAPNYNLYLTASNGGVICNDGSVVLTVNTTVLRDGEVFAWYHNGIKDGLKTGRSIVILDKETDKGSWSVVVEKDGCSSLPSNEVAVTYNAQSSSLKSPQVKVNGVDLVSAIFCKNGLSTLSVSNMSDYAATAVQVRWYEDQSLIGIGATVPFVASKDQFILRCVVSSIQGEYCDAEVAVEKTITIVAPNKPIITGSLTICDALVGTQLTATNSTGATSYKWFKDGEEIPNETIATYQAKAGGLYSVQGISAECQSIVSTPVKVELSGTPEVEFSTLESTAFVSAAGDPTIVTYQVNLVKGTGVTYTWEISNGAVFYSSDGPNLTTLTTISNTVRLVMGPSVTSVTLKCKGANSCGTGNEATHTINIVPRPVICVPPTSVNIVVNPNVTGIVVGTIVELRAAVVGGLGSMSYQWYKDGSPIPGATSATYNFTPSATSESGAYKVEVVGCEDNKVEATVSLNIIDPSKLNPGVGTFTGKTCFDIASDQNTSPECGTQASREPYKTDFTDRTVQDPNPTTGQNQALRPFTGVQVYTFTPSGTVSNVRFYYLDHSGAAVESISGGNSGNSITTPQKLTVAYKPSLNETLKGKDRKNAFLVDIIVVYNDGVTNNGTDKMVKLTARLQDCACCGAYIAPTVWKEFMCYNLGADESVGDPFTPSKALHGDFYQWGRKVVAYYGANATPPNTQGTVNVDAPNYSWTDTNPMPNNPCPAGWRVPTPNDWQGVLNNNAVKPVGNISTDNFTSGWKIGEYLFLPACGRVDFYNINGARYVTNRGQYGIYWTSAQYNVNYTTTAQILYMDKVAVAVSNAFRAEAMSVRCIAE